MTCTCRQDCQCATCCTFRKQCAGKQPRSVELDAIAVKFIEQFHDDAENLRVFGTLPERSGTCKLTQ